MRADENDVQALLPYQGEAFRKGLERLLGSPLLPQIVQANFPKVSLPEFIALVRSLPDADAFQAAVIGPAIKSLLKQTNTGYSVGGLERTDSLTRYLYLSNHRDILCDPGVFGTLLYYNGRKAPKVCLGDNLLVNAFITDLVKVNKAITVKRNLSQRELLRWSFVLSTVIRREITAGRDSVWLAQREGRAKDGNDETQAGVLKMLALTGEGSLIERLKELRIVPVAVSYEYDPCDALKARELYLTERQGKYEKRPGEDIESMALSVKGFKGGVHVEIGSEISEHIERAEVFPSKREQAEWIAREIDRQIFSLYRLWPSNYIAYDLLEGQARFTGHYTPEKRHEFTQRLDPQLALLGNLPAEERNAIRRILLSGYANPVKNSLGGVSAHSQTEPITR